MNCTNILNKFIWSWKNTEFSFCSVSAQIIYMQDKNQLSTLQVVQINSHRKKNISKLHTFNIMAVDDWAMQGAGSSAAMVLT